MIDMKLARQAFSEHLKGYDQRDPRIALKIKHTYGVVHYAKEIAAAMELSEEDQNLAMFIALLHDIGRFEQVARFGDFLPTSMDHATYGAEFLFQEGAIRKFLSEDTFDAIIHDAIYYHSRFSLPEISDPRTLLHAKLIRDADKLDNCRVKLTEDFSTMFGKTEEEVASSAISPAVWKSCLERSSVRSQDRETAADFWASYLAVYFDLNFDASWEILRREDFIPRIAGRVHYQNPDTAAKIKQLVDMLTHIKP